MFVPIREKVLWHCSESRLKDRIAFNHCCLLVRPFPSMTMTDDNTIPMDGAAVPLPMEDDQLQQQVASHQSSS